MPHNDNYLRNISWQWFGITVQRGRGLEKGLARCPEKYIARYKSNYLRRVRTQCTIWWVHAPMHLPSKISTAVKTTCEITAPSKSFLGAIYNHGRLYSDYILCWAPLVTISAHKLQSPRKSDNNFIL